MPQLIAAHFSYLQHLVTEGVVFSAGRTLEGDKNAFGIVIFQAVDEQQACAIMNADPAVSSQLMTAQLYPFKVALWSDINPLQ
ncbi:MAG: YciI family protein [Pseudomonadales bacterium]|nr:YciI family protein [Pseudomonadales bacterium]NRA14279.1 hypothetical protein [Oceanospirillaceae bacterium]